MRTKTEILRVLYRNSTSKLIDETEVLCINEEQLDTVVNELLGRTAPLTNTKRIINIVAGVYKIPVAYLDKRNNESRNAVLAECRAVVAYFLRNVGLTLMEIGNLLGVDHSTVHHYLNSLFPNAYDTDKAFRERIKLIEEQIKNIDNDNINRF